jgi:hypothetical protein
MLELNSKKYPFYEEGRITDHSAVDIHRIIISKYFSRNSTVSFTDLGVR